ncbi:carboxyltransferase domain-containing protein [Salmonella enterica subsp. enterica]|nr:carboxyltransferase domain-containing protein [Salmonella enterica subsp. enterica]
MKNGSWSYMPPLGMSSGFRLSATAFPILGIYQNRSYTLRRAEPRLQVPAGFCRHRRRADGYLSIITPGGWRLIGTHAVGIIRSRAGASGSALRRR